MAAREAAIAAFQAPDGPQLIVCATRVAAQGITLTRASNVAFLELEWTPAMHDQAEDRCHRIGQRDAVSACYLLAAETIDETMAAPDPAQAGHRRRGHRRARRTTATAWSRPSCASCATAARSSTCAPWPRPRWCVMRVTQCRPVASHTRITYSPRHRERSRLMTDTQTAPRPATGANELTFTGDRTTITYYPETPGPLIAGQEGGEVRYNGPEGAFTFYGAQIDRQDSPLGMLLTVVLRPDADAGAIKLTLLVLPVLGVTHEAPVTFGEPGDQDGGPGLRGRSGRRPDLRRPPGRRRGQGRDPPVGRGLSAGRCARPRSGRRAPCGRRSRR